MLVTPQLSAFQWDSGLWDTWVLLERLHAVKSRQPRLCTQPELVRQLSLTVHLNPAAAVLGQTSFLLCLLADKISDSLWLWFSFGLHVQCSLKILVQPTQWLPSIGESNCNVFSLNNISVVVLSMGHSHSWTAPAWSQAANSSDLHKCIKCIHWTSMQLAEGTYLQLLCVSAASGAIMGLPNPPVFLFSDRQALHLQQEKNV